MLPDALLNKTECTQVFSSTYRGYSFVLKQPDSDALLVFDSKGEQYIKIALCTPDDLIRSISVAKEMIDETFKN
jgi:hypothetical protein